MPRLKSGKDFVLSFSPLLDSLTTGSERQQYFAILAYRQVVRSPADLLPHATIGYFDTDGTGPPDGKTHSAGFNVAQVLDGQSDWSAAEVEELRAWSTETRVVDWLAGEHADLEEAIRSSPVWESELASGK